MKRGLSITLGTIAMALLANAGFANAPMFSRIPDVVIGDADDNQAIGLTVDVNFFRYDNAFNILDFITDETTSLLRFSFNEGTTHEDISINGKHNVDAAGVNPYTDHPGWRTNTNVEVTGGGSNYWFSFRDLLRSPDDRAIADPVAPLTTQQALDRRFPDPLDISSNPVTSGTVAQLPWQNIDGSNALGTDDIPSGESAYQRAVTVWASDGTTVSYKSFNVMSVNDVTDTLSGGFTTIFSDDLMSSTGWFYGSATPVLPAATSGAGSGFLSLASPTAGTAFGAWTQNSLPDPLNLHVVGPIPMINADEIYVAHMTMSHDATDRGSVPDLRLRAQMPNGIVYNQWYFRAYLAVSPYTDAEINPFVPDPGVEKTYSLYWSMNNWAPLFDNMEVTIGPDVIDTRNFALSFDLIDASATEGATWTLSSVEVGAVDRPATETPSLVMTDLTTDSSWTVSQFQNPLNANMTITNDSPAAGMITYNDPGVDLTPPGNDPPNYLIVTYADTQDWEDTVYRVTTRLSYPTAQDRDNAHRFRIRHNTTLSQLISEYWMNENLKVFGNPFLPTVNGGDPDVYTPYEVYLNGYGGATPTLRNLAGSDYGKWILALDQISQTEVDLGGGVHQNELPTKTSVHQVMYESLGSLGL